MALASLRCCLGPADNRRVSIRNDAFRVTDLYVQRCGLPRVAWGIATAWAPQPPTVQILGVQKAGTTSLHMDVLPHTVWR